MKKRLEQDYITKKVFAEALKKGPDFKVQFLPFQIEALQEMLKTTKYLTTEDRKKLKLETGLNRNQILVRFS
ncbi:unnamed protein product [Caenorhabditis brenneri]